MKAVSPIEELLAVAEGRLSGLKAQRVVIGLAYTAVLLSDGSLGLAAIPHGARRCRTHPAAGALAGRRATELARGLLSPDPLDSALGLAAVNAVLGEGARPSPDPVEAMGIERDHVVGVVGYIGPLIRTLGGKVKEVLAFERDPSRPGVLPDWAVETELPRCDVVFITGTAFANKTAGHLLELCRGRTAVIGPSTPLWEGLLDRGIDCLFGARARDPGEVLRTVAEGGGTRALSATAWRRWRWGWGTRSEKPIPLAIAAQHNPMGSRWDDPSEVRRTSSAYATRPGSSPDAARSRMSGRSPGGCTRPPERGRL